MTMVWPLCAVVQVVTNLMLDGLDDMVTVSESDREPSETVSRNVRVAVPAGAVNAGDDTVEFERVTAPPPVWVHRYVRESLSSSEEPEPVRVTVSPGDTSWSSPALAVGARLTFCTVIMTSSLPVAPLVSVTVSVRV